LALGRSRRTIRDRVAKGKLDKVEGNMITGHSILRCLKLKPSRRKRKKRD
jgi:hypothetical protein